MTSTTIYTPITPTYLYIKQHSITKKKYYGKTTNLDPYKYNGSGKHWGDHIKVHGKEHIVTLWVSELYYDTSIVEVALKFSADNDIVNSKEWANMKPENGLDGATPGVKHTEETKAKQSAAMTGKKHTTEQNVAKSARQKDKKGKPHSEETKAKMKGRPSPNKDKKFSVETKAKMSASSKGKPKKQVTCPNCGKTGGSNTMYRWHFDNCKVLH
jgi:hypothetical protein